MITYTRVSKEKFDSLGFNLTEEVGNRYRLNDYYSDYWYCYAELKEDNAYNLGIKIDFNEVATIQDLILSEINISDTYITICEKIEGLCNLSKWSLKKQLGQRKKEIPFEFVTKGRNMQLLENLFIEQDKAKCYEQFQQLLKQLNKNGND